MTNPYAPPSAPCDAPLATDSASPHPCPKCGGKSSTKVRYNWWGGALGPKLFHVVKCEACRTQYNGQTGQGLGRVILIYNLVAIVVSAGLVYLWWTAQNR